MRWLDRFMGWYVAQPLWKSLPLLPVVVPILLVVNVVFLVFVLPWLILFGRPPPNPAARLTLPELRVQAVELAEWFRETRAKDPHAEKYLGPGPSLADELVRLANLPTLPHAEATAFLTRARSELAGAKGIPFAVLLNLAERLTELAAPDDARP